MEILYDALLDSIKILPILFGVYLLIEYLEHQNNNRVYHLLMKSNRFGPLLGAIFGCIPQCGFSVIASDLYARNAITLGTILAVFISTSDEAVPILLSHPGMVFEVVVILVLKVVIAVITGVCADLFSRRQKELASPCRRQDAHVHFHGNCESCEGGIVRSAVIHAVKIFIFIFVATALINGVITAVGEDVVSGWLGQNAVLQPFIAAAVGLIPNCAASVILTQMYVVGGITFGSLVGGLCTGAGVGLIVLLKENKNIGQNIKIIAILYAVGAAAGLLIQAVFH